MIEVANLVKRYGPATVLKGATFQIAAAQLTTILGPSGCGKSTMLRCLNRLERFDVGRIVIDDVAPHRGRSAHRVHRRGLPASSWPRTATTRAGR